VDYSSLIPLVKEGIYNEYYENGNIKVKGNYQNNRRTGLFVSYYESGQKESEMEFGENEIKYLQFWNENSEPQLYLGKGKVVKKRENGNISISRYANYSLVEGMEIRNVEQDTLFATVDEVAQFPGGSEEYVKFLKKNLKYPNEARREGVEGKVYVQFIVDKSGTVSEVKSVKGIGTGCDAEAVRVIKKSPRWIPGNLKGKPVKQRMIIPIVFKLG
jgi:TonB family protein